jgi:hypothetical protein
VTGSFLNILLFLFLALWIGGMFGFGALYAPVLFRSLPSRDKAGQIAGETLARIDALGLVAGGIVSLVTILQAMEARWAPVDLLRVVIAVAMVGLVLFSAAVIRSRLTAIRAGMGKPIDEFAPEDPERVEYNRYHKLSTRLYSLVLLLGIILIALSAFRAAA